MNELQLGGLMDRKISYIPGSIICFEPNTNQRVAIQSSRNFAPVIDLQFPVTVPYARLVGRWIIECKNNTIYLRENNSTAQDDRIRISFQQPDISVRIKCIAAENENLLIHKVRVIDVYPREVGQLKVQTSEVESSTEPSGSEPTRISQPTPQPAPSNDAIVQRLQAELKREKTITKNLQEIIAGRLDDILRLANENRDSLTESNRTKLQSANALSGEMDRLSQEVDSINQNIDGMNSNLVNLRRMIQERKEEMTRLQAQLDELSAQKELADLDCDEASKQLSELKQHLNLDANTLELLEDGYRLKHGTISKSLSEMEKEIERVEKRIAFILKFRTNFNHVVEDAIFNGDGTILTSDETGGGNSDGI